MAKALTILALCVMLAACSINPPIEADGVVAYWCATNTALHPTRAQYALYTDAQRRQMDIHNTYGAKHCRWKSGGA